MEAGLTDHVWTLEELIRVVEERGEGRVKFLLIGCLCFSTGNAFAQLDVREPVAIVELGASTSQSLTGGGASFGPTVAVEVTPTRRQ
jgi:hypothetical protein